MENGHGIKHGSANYKGTDIEQTAWGGYRTEFYATYDYKNIGEQAHAKALVQ